MVVMNWRGLIKIINCLKRRKSKLHVACQTMMMREDFDEEEKHDRSGGNGREIGESPRYSAID